MNAINQIKIAITGCGAVTQELHAPTLVELQKRGLGMVAAVFDPSNTEAEAVIRMFPYAQKCESLEELAQAGCDVALVASPARFHAGQAIRCLESGLHVLCEKPMATASMDAANMLSAAKAAGRLLAVGQVRRFFPAAQMLKQIIAEHRLGEMRAFRGKEGSNFGWGARSASFFSRKSAVGGVLLDTGIHAIDLLLWWFGEPRSLTYEDDSMGGLEANCRLNLDYGTFAGSLQLSWDFEMPTGYLFEFENAWIQWHPYAADQIAIGFPGMADAVQGSLISSNVMDKHIWKPKIPLAYYQSFLPQWLNVIAAIEGREALRVPGDEAIKTLSLVEKCYACRTFMEPPWLSDGEKHRARELRSGVCS
jgi:predicted dehydrogenase